VREWLDAEDDVELRASAECFDESFFGRRLTCCLDDEVALVVFRGVTARKNGDSLDFWEFFKNAFNGLLACAAASAIDEHAAGFSVG